MRLVVMMLMMQAATPEADLPSENPLLGFDLKSILCPKSETEIVICASPDARSSFRLPDRSGDWSSDSNVPSLARERYGLLDPSRSGSGLYSSGGSALGPNPCSAVGPGGHSGCAALRHRESELQNNN